MSLLILFDSSLTPGPVLPLRTPPRTALGRRMSSFGPYHFLRRRFSSLSSATGACVVQVFYTEAQTTHVQFADTTFIYVGGYCPRPPHQARVLFELFESFNAASLVRDHARFCAFCHYFCVHVVPSVTHFETFRCLSCCVLPRRAPRWYI